MGRVIKYWIVLGAVAAFTVYGGGYLAFRVIDLTFLQFATVLCAPLLQAAVLVWRSEQPADDAAALARSVFRHPLAQPVLLIDGLLLGAGIVLWESPVIGLGAAVNVHSTWTLVKAAAATAFFGRAFLRATGRDRPAVLLRVLAPVLLVFALDPSTSWLAAGFPHVHAVAGPNAEVLLRLAFYGPLFGLLTTLTVRSAGGLARRSHEAAGLLQAAVAAALVLGVTVVLASFNLPIVVQPWLGIASLSASAATTCVLLAAIFLATSDRRPAAPQ
jgi:hypothetical protein